MNVNYISLKLFKKLIVMSLIAQNLHTHGMVGSGKAVDV